jgi:hypothetical protein
MTENTTTLCPLESDDLGDHDDDRAILELLTELAGEWATTAYLGRAGGFEALVPMGTDGRPRAMRALRRLERAGLVELENDHAVFYRWRVVDYAAARAALEASR